MIPELTDTWWRVDEVLLGLADWRSVTPDLKLANLTSRIAGTQYPV